MEKMGLFRNEDDINFSRLIFHGSNCIVNNPIIEEKGFTKDFGF